MNNKILRNISMDDKLAYLIYTGLNKDFYRNAYLLQCCSVDQLCSHGAASR